MTVVIKSSVLATALRCANHIILRRNTIPVLECVAISTSPDRGEVEFFATDLDMAITIAVPASIGRAGKGHRDLTIAAPARRLAKLVRAIAPDGDQLVSLEGSGGLSLGSDGSMATMTCLPASDMPFDVVKPGETVFSFYLPVSELVKINAFASTEAERHLLNGVCFLDNDDGVTAVATNSHALAEWRGISPKNTSTGKTAILPSVAIHKIVAVARSLGAKDISVDAGETIATITLIDAKLPVTIRSRLIDGTYPNYRQIIDKLESRESQTTWAAKRGDMAEAISRMSAVWERYNDAAMKLSFSEAPTMSIANGDLSISIPMVGEFSGTGLDIGVNPLYLGRAVSWVGGETVTVAFDRANDPMSIRSPDSPGRKAVVMPMRA